jgi:hypothetical protein
MTQAASYLLAGQPTELERLQLQSRVWEPAGRALLAQLPGGSGRRALDLGCGVLGWLRVLRIGWPAGTRRRIRHRRPDARWRSIVRRGGGSRQRHPPEGRPFRQSASGRVVRSRPLALQIAPLGRAPEQITVDRRLVKPGGWIVLEDPDMASWRVNPDAPAVQRLIDLIKEGFRAAGGDFNAGRELPSLFGSLGVEPHLDAHVVALSPGHPYLRLPLQFAASLRPRLEALIGKADLDDLVRRAELELSRPSTWGTTFTLIQAYASLPV